MFLDPGSDPREGGPRLGDERATLTEFLRGQRLTLQLKCDGLDAGQLARRGVNRPRCPCWAWSGTWPRWNAAGSAAGSPG